MTDWTARIIELEDAKAAMISAKKQIKAEEERKALKAARTAIANRVSSIEYDFAQKLLQVSVEGMPQALIRKEVLRTNDWATWVYWRDMADIIPERTTARNEKAAKALANSPFRWAGDFSTLTVLRTSTGDTLREAIIYDMATNKKIQGKWWWPDPITPENELAERAAHTLDSGFKAYVSAEIQRQIDAGNISGED